MRIAFTTLGCKINQFETDEIRQDLLSRGSTIVPFDAEADVYVINTCSVTAKSDYQSRQVIRSAVRRGNGARVVVTGCYAETRSDEVRKIPGVDQVIGNSGKTLIPDLVFPQASEQGPEALRASKNGTREALSARTRGFLKIQDGCDNQCSYCIVPMARGSSRSVCFEDILREFELLVQNGCPEVVLTGIHIGTYGPDLEPPVNLTKLIKTLIDSRGRTRIRLSSIEPNEITEEMITYLGHGLCRHLHVPLQSGDDAILSSMKRKYTSHFYLNLLDSIACKVPGMALGADVMVGFPGEGDVEFKNTFRLLEQSPLTHLHIFSYSPRPGTAAAEMKNQVGEHIKKERNEALRTLGKTKNLHFRRMQLGLKLSVVVENKVDPDSGLLTGLTDNYIRVHILGGKTAHIGKEIMINLNEVTDHANYGSIL